MIKYLINLGMFYQPKNKLHKAVQEIFSKEQRKVIERDDLRHYEVAFRKAIDDLNKQFPNCTPVKLNIWSPDGKDECIQIESLVGLSMLQFTDQL